MITFGDNPIEKIALDYHRNTTTSDQYCEKHERNFITILKTNTTTCPDCYREKQQQENVLKVSKQYELEQEQKRNYFLTKLSIMDSELEKASFDNFKTDTKRQREVLDWAKTMANEWYKGDKGNILMYGEAGRGKSHLAFSIIKGLSDLSKNDEHKKFGLMINMTDLLTEIKKDFSKESFWIEKLEKVDYLVLDDIGAEKISDWSVSILYSLLNKRTNTIITTNLTSEEIRRSYGSRIVSRMLKGCDERHMMNFEGLEDERRKLWKK